MRLQHQHGLECERNLARKQRAHCRCAPAIGHMLQLQAGKLFDAGQVEYGPGNPQIRNSRSSAGGSWRPSIKPRTVSAGTLECTAISIAVEATMVIGAKSFTVL